LTRPRPLALTVDPGFTPDAARGEVLYHAASCGACHAAPQGSPGADEDLPAGGAAFKTPIGTFYPGNLTPDPETGLGRWSDLEFVNAVKAGLSPDGTHYFPAFPYPSYRSMRTEDVLDLHAYLGALPAVSSPTREPDVPLRPLARRGVGLWKRFAFERAPFAPDPDRSDTWNRGAYLVAGPGHCGECHTPRNWMMIPDERRLLAGGPHPGGEGQVPSLRGLLARGRYKDVADLALALQYGETLGYERLSSGGMGEIQSNLGKLPESDLRAIAEYLLSLD
jgi:mono/diheme cytochrome c family protein